MDIDIETVLTRLHTFFGITKDSELSELMGEGRSTISAWRTRGTIPYQQIAELSRKYDLNVYWALYGEEPMHKSELSLDRDYTSVAKYDLKVSAGTGYEILNSQVVDYFKYKTSWLKSKGIQADKALLVEVSGDSMEPKLQDGDLVLIDMSKREIINGKAYVVRVDNQLVVKYVHLLPGDKCQLISENSIYPPINIDSFDQIEVLGRVYNSNHDW